MFYITNKILYHIESMTHIVSQDTYCTLKTEHESLFHISLFYHDLLDKLWTD